jgi:bifunctional DNA-binding transcriptional regulator/antitoxin component of YhaV-PrlF toxin-antitoxin module
MTTRIVIQKIGDDHCVTFPQEILDRFGWKEGQVLELHSDDTGIELFDPQEVSDEDFHRQLLAAKVAMRKYHVALSALAKT